MYKSSLPWDFCTHLIRDSCNLSAGDELMGVPLPDMDHIIDLSSSDNLAAWSRMSAFKITLGIHSEISTALAWKYSVRKQDVFQE